MKQDFYATVYLMGFAEICAAEATRFIETAEQDKNLKYKRKANMNRTIHALRNNFWRILLESDTQLRLDLLTSFASIWLDSLNLSGQVVPRNVPPPEINASLLLKNLSCLKLMAVIPEFVPSSIYMSFYLRRSEYFADEITAGGFGTKTR